MKVEEFPPHLDPLSSGSGFPLNGGRVHSISVNPVNSEHIVVANEFGGLWKTEDSCKSWIHLDLNTVFVNDVAYSLDGNTIIATLERDNSLPNGGGIWFSDDGGKKWNPVGDIPNNKRIPNRKSAYGIAFDPYKSKRVYVGTDFGVATSTNNGLDWTHKMIEDTSRIWANKKQNSVLSILALKGDTVVAVYQGNLFLKKGAAGWKIASDPSWWTYSGISGIKNLDVWSSKDDYIFTVTKHLHDLSLTLNLYEVGSDKWTRIRLPDSPTSYQARFVRISKSLSRDGAKDIWVGTSNKLLKATCTDVDSVKSLELSDWHKVAEPAGSHHDSGYLGLNKDKKPVLYGSNGGLFKPEDEPDAVWHSAALEESGLNSYKITDFAGTSAFDPYSKKTSLYLATDDNGIWASLDNGSTWIIRDVMSGYSFQAPRNAPSSYDLTTAYTKVDLETFSYVFSDFTLEAHSGVPNFGMKGDILSNMAQPFLISGKNWIRYRFHGDQTREVSNPVAEIYVSKSNGSNWEKIAYVSLEMRGGFVVSGPADDPVIYAPFKGRATGITIKKAKKKKSTKPLDEERETIGLLRLSSVFEPKADSEIPKYNDKSLISLPDNGSLGLRATKYNTQAVFGVDPKDPEFIIAPDIKNQRIMVREHAGKDWRFDENLTNQVTNYGRLLIYDGDPYHMQVTQIAFDPNNSKRILVGTRDSGIIITDNRGVTWSTIPFSEQITYITSFFFNGKNSVIVSSYGRGLWQVDLTGHGSPFETYCRGGDCRIRLPFDPHPPIYERHRWGQDDIIIFLDGRINGLMLDQNNIKKITVTEGTSYRRFPGKSKNPIKVNVIESNNGVGFKGLEGCLAAIQEGEIIKGVILRANKIFGVISGKEEFRDI